MLTSERARWLYRHFLLAEQEFARVLEMIADSDEPARITFPSAVYSAESGRRDDRAQLLFQHVHARLEACTPFLGRKVEPVREDCVPPGTEWAWPQPLFLYPPRLRDDDVALVATFAHQHCRQYLRAGITREEPAYGWSNLLRLADLGAVALGYGVFLCNSTHRFAGPHASRSPREPRRPLLNAEELAFALAIACVRQELNASEVEPHLVPRLRSVFRRSLARIEHFVAAGLTAPDANDPTARAVAARNAARAAAGRRAAAAAEQDKDRLLRLLVGPRGVWRDIDAARRRLPRFSPEDFRSSLRATKLANTLRRGLQRAAPRLKIDSLALALDENERVRLDLGYRSRAQFFVRSNVVIPLPAVFTPATVGDPLIEAGTRLWFLLTGPLGAWPAGDKARAALPLVTAADLQLPAKVRRIERAWKTVLEGVEPKVTIMRLAFSINPLGVGAQVEMTIRRRDGAGAEHVFTCPYYLPAHGGGAETSPNGVADSIGAKRGR